MPEFTLHDKIVNCKMCSIAEKMKYCEKCAFRDALIIIKAEKEIKENEIGNIAPIIL